MQTEIKIEAVYPLLPAQQGLLVDSLAGENDIYRQQICVEIIVPISIDALRQNIYATVKRHELLRTIFDWSDNNPLRVVVDGIEPSVHVFSNIGGENALLDILMNEKAALKPVNETPPIRFAIIEYNGKQLLTVTYHHVLLDGPSVDLLLQQIIKGDVLPESPNTAYSEWYKRNVGNTEHAIWKAILATINKEDGVLTQSTERNESKLYTAQLNLEFYRLVLEKAKVLHTTPAVYIQTLWSIWAQSYFEKESFLYGLVVSTRRPDLTDNVMGPYISTIPWPVSGSVADIDSLVQQTNNRILDIQVAKHMPLGNIAKYASPLAMNFDSILTITTRPVEDTSLYKIIKTSENTGYILSVDIEISNSIEVTFSTLLENMEGAVESFVDFCKNQVGNSTLLPVNNHYQYVERIMAPEVQAVSLEVSTLTQHIAAILNVPAENILATASFLEAGGDSIAALRLKARLKSYGFETSVGDILKTTSLSELAQKIRLSDSPRSDSKDIHQDIRTALYDQFEESIEDLTYIPSAAYALVTAYRNGFGQDYHEQTAFRLKSFIDQDILAQAFHALGLEFPTLRFTYPEQYPELQVLLKSPRLTFRSTDSEIRSFERFVIDVNEEDWAIPYDIADGALLKATVAKVSDTESYLFISFSALVTDGWSFSTMLERLFEIYNELLIISYTPKAIDTYLQHSKAHHSHQPPSYAIRPLDNEHVYSSVVSGNDFVIEKETVEALSATAKLEHTTVSDVLVKCVTRSLYNKNFSELQVYENGRDSPESFNSVGPYSTLTSYPIDPEGRDYAYYVFENYPRESENRLRNGEIYHFKEEGNWRRDLMPPRVTVGFLFDEDGDTVRVRLFVRGNQEDALHISSKYWDQLLRIIKNYSQTE